ncbi:MAG: hypothetical protein RLZZ337_589 [Bacteroidota bacterium]|jgi:hypothetical protein
MGNITRNRVIYAGTDILISDTPSWEDQTNFSNLKLLKRVQSSAISISNPVSRSRQIGSSEYAFQKYTQTPEIQVGINYYLSDNSNELLLGLVADGSSGIFSNFAESGKDRNLYFALTEADGLDADDITNAVGLDVFAVGNAFLSSYSLNAQVGDIPSVDLSFDCVNMTFQTYAGTGPAGSEVPAINLPAGNKSTEKYLLSGYNFDLTNYLSNQADRASALRPGDINLELQQPIMGGARYSGQSPANITSMQINLPIERRDLVGFGSNFPYDKRIIFPIVGTIAFEGYIDEPVTGDFSNIFDDENAYDLIFNFKKQDQTTGFRVEIENARVESQSFNQGIGDNLTFSSEFSFSVSATAGFKVSGTASLWVDDEDAVEYLDTVNERDTTTRSGINKFVKTLKSEGLWDKISGVYPLVGDTGYYGYNLKDPRDSDEAFRLSFSSENTVRDNGIIWFVETHDYANTHFNPNNHLAGNTVHISVLNTADESHSTADIGCIETDRFSQPRLTLILDYGGGFNNDSLFQIYNPESTSIIVEEVDSAALYIASRDTDSSAFLSLYNSSTTPTKTTSETFSIDSTNPPNLDMFFGAANVAGSPEDNEDADRQYGFLSFGEGLSPSEAEAYYLAIKNLYNVLGRHSSVFT